MSDLARLKKEAMNLTPEEREHLALSAWESLGDGSDSRVSGALDPEGLEIARQRDRQISSGVSEPITHSEFLRRIDNKK